MTRGLVLALAVAALAAIAAVRAFSVTEGSGSGYEPCSPEELAPFAAELSDCATRSSYNWKGIYLPNMVERQELCACKLLMTKLQKVPVPYCGLSRRSPADNSSGIYNSSGFYSYQDVVEKAFSLCSTTASSTTATTITRTTAPTTTPTPTKTPSYYDDTPYTYAPTYAPYTYAPTYTYSPSFDLDTSNSSSSKKGNSKAGLIVGILVAVGVVSAVAAFVVRKKRNNAKRAASGHQLVPQGGKRSHSTHSQDSDLDAGVIHATVGVQGELSPLGVGAAYAKMPPSPSAPAYKDAA